MAIKSNLKYVTDYDLREITLITSTGIISLKNQLVELNFFEDIFAGTLSAQLVVSDGMGIIAGVSMNGTEYIKITLDKAGTPGTEIERMFRVFSVSNRSISINNTFENYTINMCSDEFMLSEQYRICKSYKNESISNIIKDILTRFLKVGTDVTKTVSVEDTVLKYDFILPNKKIFETINWLSTYAMPMNGSSGTGNGMQGADMLFFENNDGFFFASLSTLYKQDAFANYVFAPKNIQVPENLSAHQQFYNVLNFEILDSFDTLRATTNGTFSNRLITFDPLTRKKYVTDYSYDEMTGKKNSSLNPYPVTNNYANRFGQAMYESPISGQNVAFEAGVLRFAPSNYNQPNQTEYIKQIPGSVANDINAENFIPNRVAQLGLSQYQRVRITVPGNPQLFVGMTLNFTAYGIGEVSDKRERRPDPYLSGKYLVSAIRHVINDTSYISVVELCKESNIEAYSGINKSDALWNKIVAGEWELK